MKRSTKAEDFVESANGLVDLAFLAEGGSQAIEAGWRWSAGGSTCGRLGFVDRAHGQ